MLRTLLGLVLAVLLAPAALAQGYRIQPGDVLQMEVLEDPSLNRSLMVLPMARSACRSSARSGPPARAWRQ
jgi:polysaccharide export outer membrane protein